MTLNQVGLTVVGNADRSDPDRKSLPGCRLTSYPASSGRPGRGRPKALDAVRVTEQAVRAGERTSSTQPTGAQATSADARLGTLILSSKLHPPATRRGTVVRQALLDCLSAEMSARLVLVVAPAGWGKTSLLCDWCAVCEPERTAWLSVDQGDNDPVRFWAHLIAAVDTVSPGIGTVALEVLAAPGVKTADAVLDPVINDFARMPVRVTLVVDDYHLITSQAIQECVEFLVEHLPPTLCLVLATRSDPALPLARLRARGQMTEIRADELRFSEAEAEELLNQTLGLALPPDEVHALQQRTEGWAAGLYLAGLSLRGRKDTALIVRAFSGDDRQIVDYFAAEVLDGLPPRVRVHGIWKSGETGGLRRAGERCYSSDRGQPDPGCHGRAGQPQNDWHPRPFVSRPAGRPLAAGKIAGSGASCSPRPRNKRCQRPPFPRR